ncbi:Protein soga3 [Branchiostoma belcheri]|nr:Protein soga3 [Branchiostoma belcheri]
MADVMDPDMERCQSAPPGDPYVYRTELVRKWEEEKRNLMHMFEEERNQWQEQISSMQSKIHEVTKNIGKDASPYIEYPEEKDTIEIDDDAIITSDKSKDTMTIQSSTDSDKESQQPRDPIEPSHPIQHKEEGIHLAKTEPVVYMMSTVRDRTDKSRLLDRLRPNKDNVEPYDVSKFEKKLSSWRRSLAPKDVSLDKTRTAEKASNYKEDKASLREELGVESLTTDDEHLEDTSQYGRVKPRVVNLPLLDDDSDEVFTAMNVSNIVKQFETSSKHTRSSLHDNRPRSRTSSAGSLSGTDDENMEGRTRYRKKELEMTGKEKFRQRKSSAGSLSGTDGESVEGANRYKKKELETKGKEKFGKRKGHLKIKCIEIEGGSDVEKDLDEREEDDVCTSPFLKESRLMKWPSVENIREVFQGRVEEVLHEEVDTTRLEEAANKKENKLMKWPSVEDIRDVFQGRVGEVAHDEKIASRFDETATNNKESIGKVEEERDTPRLDGRARKNQEPEVFKVKDNNEVDSRRRSDDEDPANIYDRQETDDYKETRIGNRRKKELIKMFEQTRRIEGLPPAHLGVCNVGYSWQFDNISPGGAANVDMAESELVQEAHKAVSMPLKDEDTNQSTEPSTEDVETDQQEAPPTETSWQARPPEFQALRPFSPVFDDPVPKRKQLDSSGLTQAQKHNANTEEILRWEIEKRQLKRTLDEALRQIASVTDDLQTYKVRGIGPLKRSKSQSDLRSLQELDSAMETLYHTSGASQDAGYTASYSNRHPNVTSAQTLCSSSNQNRGYYRYATEVPYRGRVDDVSGPPAPPRSTSFRMATEGYGEVKAAQKPVDRKPKKYSKRSHTAPIPDRREVVNGKLNGDDLMHPSQFKALKQLFEARTQSGHGGLIKPMNFANGATGPYVVVPKRSVGMATGKGEEEPGRRLRKWDVQQLRVGDSPPSVPLLPGSSIVPVGAVPVLGIPVRGLSKLVREKEAMKAQAERDERNARMEPGMKHSPSVSLDSPRDSTDRSTTSEETSVTQELLDEILLRRSDDQRTPSPASDRSSPKLVAQNVRVVSPERGPPSTEPFVPKSAAAPLQSSGPYENVASWLGQSRIQNVSLANHEPARIQNVSLANHEPALHSEPPIKQLPSEKDTYSRHSPSLMDSYGNSDISSRPLGRHQTQDTPSYLQMDRSKSVDSHLSRGRRGADDFYSRLAESRTKTERIEEAPVKRGDGLVKSLTFPEERVMVERSRSAPPTRHLELHLDESTRLTSKPPRPVYPERVRRLAGEISSDSIRFPDGGTLATRKLAVAEERYREGNRLARAAAAASEEGSGAAGTASFGRGTYPARSRQEQMRYQINRDTGIPALDRRLASMRQLLHTEDLEDILTPSYQRYKSNEQHLSSYRREEHHSVGTASSVSANQPRSKQEKQPKKKSESTTSATSRARSSSETVRLYPAPRLDAKFSRPQPANRRLPSRWSQVQDHPMADRNTNQNATVSGNVHMASSSHVTLQLPSRGEWHSINETAV